jgi:hypothetical protein
MTFSGGRLKVRPRSSELGWVSVMPDPNPAQVFALDYVTGFCRASGVPGRRD